MNEGKPQKQAVAIAMNIKNKKKMAKGGMVERNEPNLDLSVDEIGPDRLPSESNSYDDGHSLSLAMDIMHKRAVERENHAKSEQNYAMGGEAMPNAMGEPMMGTDSDEDEHLDNALNSDQMPDDAFSADGPGSLATSYELDNTTGDAAEKKAERLKKAMRR